MHELLTALALALTALSGTLAEPVTYGEIREVETPAIATLHPELVPICTCESGQGTGKPQHFNIQTGEVLRGVVNPQDIGMCQINLKYHQAAAERMGLDVFKEEDNIAYANWLFEQEGSTPWNWSKPCWGNGS